MAYLEDEKKKDLVSDYVNNYANINVDTQKLLDTYLQKANQQYSFDPNASKVYQDAVKRYTEMGKTAMEDTMGKAAGLTGGFSSSYATVAGQQAYNQYMQQLPAVEQQIRAQDYAEYQNNLANSLNAANLALNIDNQNYTRDYNERAFQFEKDQADRSQNNWQQQFDYQKSQDALSQSNWEKTFNYQKSQDAAERAYRQQLFDYQKQQDTQSQSNWEKEYELNKLAQDYSKWLNEQKAKQAEADKAAAQQKAYSETYNKIYDKLSDALRNWTMTEDQVLDYIANLVYGKFPVLDLEDALDMLDELGIDASKFDSKRKQ